jgi:ribose transport system substrate-binding protein
MSGNARKFRLVALTKNKENPAYIGARLGADRVAARHGCVLTHAVPDTPDDIDEQHALLKSAHAERPDAVLIVPAHPTALNGTLQRMQADGIRVVSFVGRPEGIACTCHVGSDDRALARGIAGYLLERLARDAAVATIEGHPDSITTPPRMAGFRDALSAHDGAVLAGSRCGYYLRDGGHAAMADLLAAAPRIDGVLAANDFMALGAIDALREKARKVPIVGINATPDGVVAIKAGDLLASASFDAMKMACLATEAAVRALSGQSVPPEIVLPVEIVDRSNCEAWDLPYAERALPEWQTYAKS